MKSEYILEVKDLDVSFVNRNQVIHAVNGVSFNVKKGESIGIVGESGSGKTVTIKTLMSLFPKNSNSSIKGEVLYKGKNILKYSEDKLRELRGNEISMVFQNPMTAFNPVVPIGKQIAESLEFHTGINKRERRKKVIEMLEEVGITNPEYRINQYPHEFSGGMLQRAMIASGLICSPELVLADEPTTGLDVTIQTQIVKLMNKLKEDRQMSLIWITHDLSLLAGIADRIVVMYGGKIVETGTVDKIYDSPKHPYTQGLLKSIPTLLTKTEDSLSSIEGIPPDPKNLPNGCAFYDRCFCAKSRCAEQLPCLVKVGEGEEHMAACLQYLT